MEGMYIFYCVDKANNRSTVTSTITLDKTKPTGTLYAGNMAVASGTATNAAYIKFVPYDAIGVVATYVKKSGSSSYEAYTSGTPLTAEGTYSLYSKDQVNTSDIYTVTLDRDPQDDLKRYDEWINKLNIFICISYFAVENFVEILRTIKRNFWCC